MFSLFLHIINEIKFIYENVVNSELEKLDVPIIGFDRADREN